MMNSCPCLVMVVIMHLLPVRRPRSGGPGGELASQIRILSDLCLLVAAVTVWSLAPDSTGACFRSSSPSRNRTWSDSFGSWRAIRHTHGPWYKYPDLESNQDQGFRTALCDPLHYRDQHISAEPTT